jgi:hypothetical protein
MEGCWLLIILTISESNNSHLPTVTPQLSVSLAVSAASLIDGKDTLKAYDTFGMPYSFKVASVSTARVPSLPNNGRNRDRERERKLR